MNTISQLEEFNQKTRLFKELMRFDCLVIMRKSISIAENKSKEDFEFIGNYKSLAKKYEKIMGIKIFDFTNDDSFISSVGNYITATAKIRVGA